MNLVLYIPVVFFLVTAEAPLSDEERLAASIEFAQRPPITFLDKAVLPVLRASTVKSLKVPQVCYAWIEGDGRKVRAFVCWIERTPTPDTVRIRSGSSQLDLPIDPAEREYLRSKEAPRTVVFCVSFQHKRHRAQTVSARGTL